jgi:multidrug resistance efflux pump
VGAYVDTSTYLTISDLTTSDVSVTIDETDLEKLHIGAKANVVFDALPNEIYYWRVIPGEPELSTSGQFRVASAIVSRDDIAGSKW